VSELEEYLLELFLSKIDAALADNPVEFTPEEIAVIIALSIQNTLSSKLIKIHSRR